jgi:dTDP-4-dehydrorhamnose reductase
MRILITGAHGLVGRALANQYRGEELFVLGHRDLDITEPESVERLVRELRPEVMFNCAVVGVDECEENRELAYAVNVAGPAHLAEAARGNGASIVHFSTNYVFDGERLPVGSAARSDERNFYEVSDEARPVNVYGQTKLDGERCVLARGAASFIIRTSWVFGEGKESFLSTVGRRLRAGERVKAIDDVWASTTFVSDLVRRVAEIVRMARPGTYHVVNRGVCSYEEFAREAARLVGADPTLIEAVSERSLMRAPRPRCTPMSSRESEALGLRPMRHWTAALAEFLASP